MFLAERDGALAGFYSLILQDEPELDLMFVADTAQATGIGTLLIGHLRDEARRLGISTIQIVSHPPSVGFYQRMGATIVGLQAPADKAAWERPILSLPEL